MIDCDSFGSVQCKILGVFGATAEPLLRKSQHNGRPRTLSRSTIIVIRRDDDDEEVTLQ